VPKKFGTANRDKNTHYFHNSKKGVTFWQKYKYRQAADTCWKSQETGYNP
jgi:hypothetical protein